ncbi:acid resistance periplasmic serine protease MarP [Acrocarpospora phusangensis]|uniref:Acid resistance periplasmic serine protease MarP n=1 Tax=Acrocarpospora phusangensis TaxID=1070424 RepID=A0A919QDK0_9ACTN|nr:MarP family serine protease [Acrocarpospora phusangensis]GIH25986.1 acid resistance periplasmic serine protease MarP [Acrocarpospora phusangensis]
MQGDVLDLILIGLVLAFAVSGYRQGFIIGVFSFVGFCGGALVGIFIAPPIAGALVGGDTEKALLAIVIVFLCATVGQFASSTIGAVVRSHVTWESARTVDSFGGSLASGLTVLVFAWLIGSLMISTSLALPRQQINDSLLLKSVDSAMPQAAKDLTRRFRDFVDASDFPEVFSAIGGSRFVDVPAPDESIIKDPRIARARRAIVKVQGTAPECKKRIEGTGFVYSPHRIMTNAHVVQGVTQELRVTDYTGAVHDARVVLFNPDRDIAILYVASLDVAALRFDSTAESKDDAIIAGFPKGHGFTIKPARIRVKQHAESSDIYNDHKVDREVYAIRGIVQPGNSGGPLLTPEGRVYGVIFAAATDQEDTGYALTADEVRTDAEDGSAAIARVNTQTCD